jgi:hypothetical protein
MCPHPKMIFVTYKLPHTPSRAGARIPDARIADGSVFGHRPWGPVMTVTYQSPLVTFAHEEGPNADVGSFQAACCNPVCANS